MPPNLKGVPRPRFTHFISFPLRSPNFTYAAAAFGDSLLAATPPITGMHPSIVMAPVRLHLTITLMSLVDGDESSESEQDEGPRRPRTIQEAISHLERCRATVDELVQEHARKRLDVGFDRLSTFQTNLTKCQVLYAEPTSEIDFLYTLARAVATHFTEAGFEGEDRPLTLHCTLINASKRKGQRSKRIPFDASRIIPDSNTTLSLESSSTALDPVPFEGLGSVPIDRIQLCEMGSSDHEGAYRAVAELKIFPELETIADRLVALQLSGS